MVSAALFALLFAVAQAADCVFTTSGEVTGLKKPGYDAYLGIPYARPPVGPLRWRTAQPLNTPKAIINASSFYPACGQAVFPGYGSVFNTTGIIPPPAEQSEDCLALNIWTPTEKKGAELLPVILFVYGGAFLSGDGSAPYVGGSHVASTGRAIFVNVNYRLNIWGYPSAVLPANSTAIIDTNTGITDVRLALEWVQKNILFFGGDPGKIVISGQSAGSITTEFLMYQYSHDPIARGSIQLSGSIATDDPAPSTGAAWNTVAGYLGCGNVTTEVQIACMRTIPFEDVVAVTLASYSFFGVSVDNKTVFPAATYKVLGASGKYPRIPSILSNVNNEGSLFVAPYSKIYPNGTTQQQVSATYTCPASTSAQNRRRQGLPVWRSHYLPVFTHDAPFPSDPNVGAYHCSDVLTTLGTYGDVHIGSSYGPVTPAESSLSAKMLDSWLIFAEDPYNGLSDRLGWPLYDQSKKTLVEIGANNSSSFTLVSPAAFDAYCPQ